MSSNEPGEKHIEEFFAAIKPASSAYTQDSFSFFALKTMLGNVLIQSTLFLNVGPTSIPIGRFESESILVGHFYLEDGALTREALVQQACLGRIETPHGDLIFPTSASGRYGTQYHPLHATGLQTQSRVGVLAILGDEISELLDPQKLDWELRAAPSPYDGLQDLLKEFQPGTIKRMSCLEVIAFTLAMIESTSAVSEEIATIRARIARTVAPDDISIGYRVLDKGKVIRRDQIRGSALSWQESDLYTVGTIDFPVPRASIVHAVAVYKGIAQHHYYFGDHKSFPNPRRATYEAFDPNLQTMNDILFKSRGPRPESRDFEAAMPWLFWMLGFSPAYIGGPRRMSDSADFVMAVPAGNIAVVECTVGLLKDDSKLPKLHDRTQAVKRNLEASGATHIRVLPVIITSKSRAEIRPDLEQAEKLGVHVVAREDIETMITWTLFPSDPDDLYRKAEQTVEEALSKYSQPALGLGAQNLPV